MTSGVFHRGMCYAERKQAFDDICSASNVSDATGAYVQCVAATNPSPQDSYATAWTSTLQLRRYASSTATTYSAYNRPVLLQTCEVADWSYWSPSVSAWAAAVVAIVAARLVYQRVFNRDTL